MRNKETGREEGWIFRVDFDPERPNIVILTLSGGFEKNRLELYYGAGPACEVSIVDDNDMAVPAFGPVEIVSDEDEATLFIPQNVTFKRDIRYREGNSTAWTLDLAMPKERSDKPRPAVVFVHGGAWWEADKEMFQQDCVNYAAKGFVCITVNYRLAEEATFPLAGFW